LKPDPSTVQARTLDPLPYLRCVVNYLKAQEPELWAWFGSHETQSRNAELVRQELLKGTYRLASEAHPELYAQLGSVCEGLELAIPATLYQLPQSGELPNAALWFVPGEAHLVLCGAILSLLSAPEMQAVMGHELAHYHLWTLDSGEFRIAERLLQSQAEDPRAHPAHRQTARRYRLYTEIFADRGALLATGDLHQTVTALIKIHTGLSSASGESYLRQAEEIFSSGDKTLASQGRSHPEAFIRARALRLWDQDAPELETQIAAMLEGQASLDSLDLPGQARLDGLTRRFLSQLLRPKWFQTPTTLAHAKRFYPDFVPAGQPDDSLPDQLRSNDALTGEYFAFLLLDFASLDPELERLPLSAAILWSQQLEIDGIFDSLVIKELNFRTREWNKLKKEAAKSVAEAEALL
jgi:hypothetical protein